jgi:hypothetical protein
VLLDWRAPRWLRSVVDPRLPSVVKMLELPGDCSQEDWELELPERLPLVGGKVD